MRTHALSLIAALIVAPAFAADAPPAATPAAKPAAAPAAKPTQEQVMAQFRDDMQMHRADVMAKGLTLSAAEASKFWPLFEEYQKEQNGIIDGQLKAIEKLANEYSTLSDEQALGYVNSLLARDAKMNELRVKWLAKFQTVVPARIAARAIQLDRRLSLVGQIQISTQVPLVK